MDSVQWNCTEDKNTGLFKSIQSLQIVVIYLHLKDDFENLYLQGSKVFQSLQDPFDSKHESVE